MCICLERIGKVNLYDEAITRLTWDSNKTALYELNCRLLEACQIGGLEGKTC